jgi:hypothetical protein
MTDLPATLTAFGALVAAVGVILGAWWAYRAKREATIAAREIVASKREILASKVEIIRIGDEVFEIGKRVDGRLTELLDAAGAKGITDAALAHAEGVAEGEQRQRDRQSPPETSADGGRRNGDRGGKE